MRSKNRDFLANSQKFRKREEKSGKFADILFCRSFISTSIASIWRKNLKFLFRLFLEIVTKSLRQKLVFIVKHWRCVNCEGFFWSLGNGINFTTFGAQLIKRTRVGCHAVCTAPLLFVLQKGRFKVRLLTGEQNRNRVVRRKCICTICTQLIA